MQALLSIRNKELTLVYGVYVLRKVVCLFVCHVEISQFMIPHPPCKSDWKLSDFVKENLIKSKKCFREIGVWTWYCWVGFLEDDFS
jgi:hypothetical protein